MSTTTFAALRDNYAGTRGPTAAVGKLPALTMTSISNVKLDRCPPRYMLRDWAAKNPQACFRRMEMYSDEWGEAGPNGPMDPAIYEVVEQATLTIAYPAYATAMPGVDERLDMADIQEEDARKVRDAIFGSGNYVAGQLAAFVETIRYDRADERVWFTVIPIRLRYYASQTLP